MERKQLPASQEAVFAENCKRLGFSLNLNLFAGVSHDLSGSDFGAAFRTHGSVHFYLSGLNHLLGFASRLKHTGRFQKISKTNIFFVFQFNRICRSFY